MALRYADGLSADHAASDELFFALKAAFSDDEILELTALITFEICVATFNRALEIEGQGICSVQGPAPMQTGL